MVPQTHDMISELFSPNKPKNTSDIIVIAILGIHVLGLFVLPRDLRIPVYTAVFLFWRASYNGFIGLLLHEQSSHRRLVKWAKHSGIFRDPATARNRYPRLYPIIKQEFETKIQKDYNFDKAPVEFNTWLLFRRLVDLILTCDFTAYCVFAVACRSSPVGESTAMFIARWTAGIMLVLFNLWVKVDAHRVVKDYAWYWGDFFFLIDQELTFDGVFEMAPHPMYSVGYAGFYGASLMAASYKVLLISIVAHTAQLAFLAFVENPHIDKIYNAPPPREVIDPEDIKNPDSPTLREDDPLAPSAKPSSVHKILGYGKTDLFRVTDLSALLLQVYLWTTGILAPLTPAYQAFFVGNAIFWRLWYCAGVGLILDKQSREKYWTRHFVKHGENTEEAWRQWKGFYHLSMTMSYGSFLVAAWRMYTVPPDWEYKMALLRHIVGLALVALQIWTVSSIFESLGEFGWFYGDFFFDSAPNLTYNGIYRFLNNPERILGLAGVWGVALITWSRAIFVIAAISHLLTLAFIYFIERPHMKRLYGERLRQDSGLSKSIKRSLPHPIRQFGGSVDRVIDQTVDFVEEFIDNAKPRFAAGVDSIVKDSTALFKSPSRIALTRVARNLSGYDLEDYSIEVEGTQIPNMVKGSFSGREGENARTPAERRSDFQTLVFEYGAPITVRWTAPANHSKRDWVGLYQVADNASRLMTKVASQGRWVATNKGVYDSIRADEGIRSSDLPVPVDKSTTQEAGELQDEQDGKHKCLSGDMMFSGDKLWWTPGVFEFRYHHDGKHNVMAMSLPFEIKIPRFDDDAATAAASAAAAAAAGAGAGAGAGVDDGSSTALKMAVEQALLPVVRNCFDRDADIAPCSVDEAFGSLVERDGKFAKRVVFAVHQMWVSCFLILCFIHIQLFLDGVSAETEVVMQRLTCAVLSSRLQVRHRAVAGSCQGGREREESGLADLHGQGGVGMFLLCFRVV